MSHEWYHEQSFCASDTETYRQRGQLRAQWRTHAYSSQMPWRIVSRHEPRSPLSQSPASPVVVSAQ